MGEPTILRIIGRNIFGFQVSLGFFVDWRKLGVSEKSLSTKSESMTGIAERLHFYLQKLMTLSLD